MLDPAIPAQPSLHRAKSVVFAGARRALTGN
jgi:hypothetical protein